MAPGRIRPVSIAIFVGVGLGGACRQAPPSDEASGRGSGAGATSEAEIAQWQAALTVLPRTGWVASASPATGAGNAIDASATTRWTPGSNQAANQWFQIDLGSQRTFTALRLDTTTSPNDYPRNYKVQVANNTTSWGTAPNVATSSGTIVTPGVTLIGFPSQSARYIRITLTDVAGVPWSIYDANVYDAVLPRTGWGASASINNSNAGLTIDGLSTSRWNTGTSTQVNGQWLQIDMASPRTFNQIVLDTGSTVTTQFPRGFNVTTSNDGSSFGPSIANGAGTGRFTVINFVTQQARYVRITLALSNPSTVSTPWSVEELTISGQPTVPTTHARPVGVWAASALSNSVNAGLAIDGVTGTSWTSATPSTNQWFQVDMGTLRTFTQVVVDAGTTATARTYQLQVGSSATGPWTTVISNVSGTAATVTINVPARTTRFLRINQTATSTAAWPIRELNVSGPALSRPGWVATASVTGGTDVASNAIDGVASTRWTSGTPQVNGHNFVVDMGTVQTFNQLTLDAGTSTGQFPVTYVVEVTNEGAIWTPVTTGTGTSQFITINFVTHAARYIRVMLTAGAAANWSIHELNVWRIAQPCDSITCTASDQCHVVGTCDPNTGVCSNPNAANGTTCNDTDACTTGETCQSGMCTGGSAVTCAADQCHTAGTCNPATGCPASSNRPDGTTCDDGNPCTEFDGCIAGTCQGSQQHTCVTPDSCQLAGTCNPGKASPTPPSTQGLVAWWKLEGDGSDATGTGHTLDEGGAVRAPGRVGFGMKFDGSTCMSAPIWDDARMQNTSGLTVMAWINANDPAGCPYPDQYGQRAVIGRGFDYSFGVMCMSPSAGPGVTGAVRPAGAQTWGWGGGWGLAKPDEWVHVALTWDRQYVYTYYNGRAFSAVPVVGDNTDMEQLFTIGCMTSYFHFGNELWRHFVGTVDEAMLYGRALSPQEIWSYYSAADPCAPHEALADNTACHDGDLCTLGDRCQSGTCTATSPPITCTPFDSCHEAPACIGWIGCHPHTPAPPKPDGTTCNDGDPNTEVDFCSAASCVGTADPAVIMGFEAPGRWSVAAGATGSIVGLDTNHTQGATSLEVTAKNSVAFNSVRMGSIGTVGPLALLDIMLPTQQSNPNWYGNVELRANAPSAGINNVSLGLVDLIGRPLATWQTLVFQATPDLVTRLSGVYTDLTFTIVLNVPPGQTGHYRFDNLRFSADILLTLQGIAKNSANVTKAIFTYSTTSPSTSIIYGYQANSLSIDDTFVHAPPESPPQQFVAATPPPFFVATLVEAPLIWKVAGHSATATHGSTPLQTETNPDGTKVAVLPDGRRVNLDDAVDRSIVEAIVPSDTSYTPFDQTRDQQPSTGGVIGPTAAGTLVGKFDVKDDGSAEYRLPLETPAGRNGIEPRLSLVYNSRAGTGVLGPG